MMRHTYTRLILVFGILVALPEAARPCTFPGGITGQLVPDVEPPECLTFTVDGTTDLTVQYTVRNECLVSVEIARLCVDASGAEALCDPESIPPTGILKLSQSRGRIRWQMGNANGDVSVQVFESPPCDLDGCAAGQDGSGLPMLPVLFAIVMLAAIHHRRNRRLTGGPTKPITDEANPTLF